jgi:hypothetical protein
MAFNHFLVFSQLVSHGGQPCSIFSVYVMSHKGKATSDINYNPEDGPKAYNSMLSTADLASTPQW